VSRARSVRYVEQLRAEFARAEAEDESHEREWRDTEALFASFEAARGASAVRLESAGDDPADEALAARAAVLVEGMDFRFLYDSRRKLFSIGYRLGDAEGPGQLDPSSYDLLASEARLASFVAIVHRVRVVLGQPVPSSAAESGRQTVGVV
jgi:hypothetical protein